MGCFPKICSRLKKIFKRKEKNLDVDHDDNEESQKICCVKRAYLSLKMKFRRKNKTLYVEEEMPPNADDDSASHFEMHPSSTDDNAPHLSSVEPMDFDFIYICRDPMAAKIEASQSAPEMATQAKPLKEVPRVNLSLPNIHTECTVLTDVTFTRSASVQNVLSSMLQTLTNVLEKPRTISKAPTIKSNMHLTTLSMSSRSKSVNNILSQMLTTVDRVHSKTISSSQYPTIKSHVSLPNLSSLMLAFKKIVKPELYVPISTLPKTKSLTDISTLPIHFAATNHSTNSNFISRSRSLPNLYHTNPAAVVPYNRNAHQDDKNFHLIYR